jgi:hypothetical protein
MSIAMAISEGITNYTKADHFGAMGMGTVITLVPLGTLSDQVRSLGICSSEPPASWTCR